jgi:hypothetical protein
MKRLCLVIALAACAADGGRSPDLDEDDDGCSDMLPFEATCRFAGADDRFTCSESFSCVDGEYVCPDEAQFTGARACLAECQDYVAEHPECQCVGDLMFGYDMAISCPGDP